MANVLTTASGTFVPASRDNGVANQAIASFASQDPTGQANLLQGSGMAISYDCRALAVTDDAVAFTVLDLTARGLTAASLPAGSLRVITTEAYQRVVGSTSVLGYLRNVFTVSGGNGTTPIAVPAGAGTLLVDQQIAAINASTVSPVISGNTVIIQVTGTAATSVGWDVRVYIGPLVSGLA